MYWRNDWTGFFLVYFKWCYFLCVTPFRFEWDEQAKRFRVERNRLQRVACALQYILLGIWYLKDLRKIPVDSLYKNPVVYFSLAFNLNAIYYHCGVLASSYWRHEGRYLALVNFDAQGCAPSSVKKKVLAVFLCFLFAILPLLYSLCGHQVIPSSTMWDPVLMLRCLVREGRFAFFMSGTRTTTTPLKGPCNTTTSPEISELSLFDFFLASLAFLMETSRQIMGFYSDFFPLICCLSVWTSIGAMREFLDEDLNRQLPPASTPPHHHHHHPIPDGYQLRHRRLTIVEEGIRDTNGAIKLNKRFILPYITQQSCVADSSGTPTTTSAPVATSTSSSSSSSTTIPPEKKEMMMEAAAEGASTGSCGSFLLERYEVCKSFSRTVNRALGQLLFAYVLSSIMYLSTCMDAVLVLQDWFGKLRVAFFFFVFILMFFIGSEIVNKVYGLRAWLSEPDNNAFLPERNLLVLIHELTYKSIGISGNGMFTITYSTFMTVMTTTVTFFIIILQFQKPEREDVFMPGALKNMILDKYAALLQNNFNETIIKMSQS